MVRYADRAAAFGGGLLHRRSRESLRRHWNRHRRRSRPLARRDFQPGDCLPGSTTLDVPLCPVVVTPQHKIVEEPDEQDAAGWAARQRRQARWKRVSETYKVASRSFWLGPLVTAVSRLWSAVPLLLTIFAPKVAARMRRRVSRQLLPEVRTIFRFAKTARQVARDADRVCDSRKGGPCGHAAGNIGLTGVWTRLVVILGR